MSLAVKVSHQFEQKIQERGRLYSLGGTVRVTRGDAHAERNQRATTDICSFFFAESGSSCQSCLFLFLECYSLNSDPPKEHDYHSILELRSRG